MWNMLWYTLILIALTVLPALFGAFGAFYLVSAAVLDAILLGGVVQVLRNSVWNARAWWLYKFSLLYLALLFAAMMLDRVLAR
jgi:protoheme IX farnesyltransferase